MKSDTLYFQSSFNWPNLFYEVRQKMKGPEFYDELYDLLT
jgi:hypothetical protein